MTLGARPAKIHPSWKKEGAINCLRFSLDDKDYTIVMNGKEYGLFDAKDNLIRLFTSVTRDLGPYLAELFDFKIKLPNRQNEIITPPPAYLFLPFYIDQDISWSSSWKSFDNLHQIKKYKIPLIEYHTGIKPNEYYQIQAKIQQSHQEYSNLEKEKTLATNLLNKIKEKLTNYSFDIHLDDFKNEIEELLIEYQKLKEEEDILKRKLADLYNIKIVVEAQLNIAKKSLVEVNKDFDFATSKLDDYISCPTCGAEYENNFVERFEIAKDEQRLIELTNELVLEINEVDNKINREKSILIIKTISIEKIEELLNSKKEKVQLKDLIDSQGKHEVKNIIEMNKNDIDQKIKNILIQQKSFEKRLKELENKDKKREILNTYSFYMKRYTQSLDVILEASDYSSPTKNIINTGSALPRTLVAYYFSLLEVINKYSTTTFCPIVIDSPNQQAQDIVHLDKILNFIKGNQPKDSQMILGLEEFYDIDYECEVVELTDKYSLLDKDSFDDVYDELRIYLTQMMDKGNESKLLFI